MELDHVVAQGSWYDIGLAEGRQERCGVKFTVYLYALYHAHSAQLKSLDKLTERVEQLMTSHFPEEWDELRGIADGAQIELPLLVAANFPDALEKIAGIPKPPSLFDKQKQQCSNIMFPSSQWGPLLGGTLDDLPLRFILTARPTNGLGLCCIRWPGFYGCTWGGMNSAGLAICGASAQELLPENQWTDHRIKGLDALYPQRILLRSCETIDQVIEKLSRSETLLVSNCNLSLMDKTGRGIQVQGCLKDSFEPRIIERKPDAAMCCGNVFPWEVTTRDAPRFPELKDKFSRYANLEKAVEKYKGNYSVEAMKQVLTSHDGDTSKLHTICNNATIVAMIAAPTTGKLLLASRPPCIRGFKDFSV